MSLPTTDAERKALPIFDGVLMYFPDALMAVAAVSKAGNDQHNPGQPLHWARGKSMDQFNTGLRHSMDHRMGTRYDTDGGRHLAKAAWRALAALQLDIEEERANGQVGKNDAGAKSKSDGAQKTVAVSKSRKTSRKLSRVVRQKPRIRKAKER